MLRHYLLALMALVVSLQMALALPLDSFYSSSVFIEGDKFYIQGGVVQNGTSLAYTTQFFYIDLSSSWINSSPTITTINSTGGPNTSSSPVTLNRDNTSMIIFATPSIYTYNFQTTLWSSFSASTFLANIYSGAATDPQTGYIYVPQGHVDGGMLQYDPATQTAASIPMPSGLLASNTSAPYLAATIWNSVRNSIITAGTPTATNPNFVLYEYSFTSGWTVIAQQGQLPIADDAYCLVPAYGGTKLVYFGGTHLGFYDTDVFVFDIATNTWTKMATQIGQARVGMQCATSGDMFVAWGGGPYRSSFTSATPLVYNMKAQLWQNTFEASTSTNTSTPTSTPTSGSGPAPGSGSGSTSASKVPIVGGVVGGLFVLGVIVGALVYRKRKIGRSNRNAIVKGASLLTGERKPSDDFPIGEKQGQAAIGLHPNIYGTYSSSPSCPPSPSYSSSPLNSSNPSYPTPAFNSTIEKTSRAPLRGPQVYLGNQDVPQIWAQRPERNPQEGYQIGFQDYP